ncbi:MAG: zinc metallopeptidase [Oscillospiraceae bacterium]|jgi:Zn-dependent membrane protease YugP|nr:zinc metallopeptidase [Oscillospiraceae bacterium]
MFFYGFDRYFAVLVVPALIFSMAMQLVVKGAYRKQSRVSNARHMTGAQAALAVLRHYNIHDVRIENVPGKLNDHYDPRAKVIRLSEGVFNTASVAAVGIAAHEAGHAAQHAARYVPIRVRNAILPACNIGSSLGLPLVFIGFALSFDFLVTLGLLLFALIVVFQLVTLPVEFNASKRALQVIESEDLLDGSDYKGARQVLRAAAMTYVAALVVSVANLLRFALRFGRRR